MSIKIAYARQIGTMHLLQELPCQDYAGGQVNNECACVALADGAGSISDSEVAARTVVEVLTEEFVDRFDEWYSTEENAFRERIIKECTDRVKEKNIELTPACTALLFAIKADGKSVCCHIGDGAIIGVTKDGTVKIVSKPENGNEPNQTFFISGPDPQKHLRINREEHNEYKTIILCSDGISESLWNQYSNQHAPAINRISDWIGCYSGNQVSERLESELDLSFRTHTQDDMSIAVISIEE